MTDHDRIGQTSTFTALGGQSLTSLRWHVAIGLAALAAVQSTVALVSAESSTSSSSRGDGSPVDDDVLARPQPYRCAAGLPPSAPMVKGPSSGDSAGAGFQLGPDFADSVCNSLCGGGVPAHHEEPTASSTMEDNDRGSVRGVNAAEVAALALVTGMCLMGCAYSVKLLCRKRCKCRLCSGHYQLIKRLGSGGFGEVYLVASPDHSKELFAAKKIPVSNVTEADSFSSEAKELARLHHRYIVSYVDDFIHIEYTLWGAKTFFFVLMEYCSSGDVKHQVEKNFGQLTEATVLAWFQQLCQAVQYLHSQNVIHRDIKSQNVFLTENGDVRLGDFGLCKHDKIRKETNRGGRLKRTLRKPFALYRRAATAMSTSSDSVQVGTDCYMSPEMLCSAECGKPADVWSLGCVLFEMCSGKFIWELDSNIGIDMISDKSSPSEVYSMLMSYMSPCVGPGTRSLVKKILDPDPRKRPTIGDILRKKVVKRSSRSASSVRFGIGESREHGGDSGVDIVDDESTSSSDEVVEC